MLLPVIMEEHILPEIGCVSECSWWFVRVLCAGHCLLPSLWNWVLLHIQGDRKLFTGRLGIPPVKRKYKRATLRNAVGEHTCIQEHNELLSLLGFCNGLSGSKDFFLTSSMYHTMEGNKNKICMYSFYLSTYLVGYGSILYLYADNYYLFWSLKCRFYHI